MTYDCLDIERSVIGSFLLFDSLIDKIHLVSASDFTYPPLVSIISLIHSRFQADGKFDFVLIATDCSPSERIELKSCMDAVISIHCFDGHLNRLLELSQKRRLSNRLGELVFSDFDLLDIQKIVDDESALSGVEQAIDKNNKNIDLFIAGLGHKKPRILTGISSLDRVTGGIRKACVFYLGARPSVGKTALAINIAVNQQRYNQKLIVFSLEMSSDMIFERIISCDKHIEYRKFTTQSLSPQEVDCSTAHMHSLKQDANIIVIDDCYTIEAICNTISQVKPDLVIIDFIQIVTTASPFRDERLKMNYISSELKRSAKRSHATIIALSQLTRDAKLTPTMSNLKESGNLEADGDYIALLHRPFVENKSNPDLDPQSTELILDKNKFGRTGKIDLRFDLKFQKFYEVDRLHAPQS